MSIVSGQTISATDVLAMVNASLTNSATKSLTTVAGETVVVIANGTINSTTGLDGTVSLKYNGVTKNSVDFQIAGTSPSMPFMLMYTETPGATQNITVTTSAEAIANVSILVIKLNTKS